MDTTQLYQPKPHNNIEGPRLRLRVCIASPEFAGVGCSGEIGAAYATLARALAREGHDVTCLWTDSRHASSQELQKWMEIYQREGLSLVVAPEIPQSGLIAAPFLVKSLETYQWLKKNDRFDVIHFPEWQGSGYETMLAKQQGLAFDKSIICVGLHRATAWIKLTAGEHVRNLGELEMDYTEKQCVAMADIVVSPSLDRLQWIEERGWPVGANCFIQPNLAERAGQPATPDANEKAWIDWHESAARESRAQPHPTDPAVWPRVSLCLTTFNRPALLRQAVASIRLIKYPDLEVVLVDDGSTQPEAQAFLAELEPEFEQRGWRIVRQKNTYLGAARNTAARHATGEYLLFMDDDNCATPDEVTVLVKAALRSGADLVTCGANYFEGQEPPKTDEPPNRRWLPLGGSAAAGVFENCFGDANGLVRRSCYERLGGNSEDRGIWGEDWEFYGRAVMQGFKLTRVPEFLFWYRYSQDSIVRSTNRHLGYLRGLRPYASAMPEALRPVLYFAQGMYDSLLALEGKVLGKPEDVCLAIAWRAKLEAAREFARRHEKKTAVRFLIEAVKVVENCRQPVIILETLLTVGEEMRALDTVQATRLLRMAGDFAKAINHSQFQEAALKLLATIPQPLVVPASFRPMTAAAVA